MKIILNDKFLHNAYLSFQGRPNNDFLHQTLLHTYALDRQPKKLFRKFRMWGEIYLSFKVAVDNAKLTLKTSFICEFKHSVGSVILESQAQRCVTGQAQRCVTDHG